MRLYDDYPESIEYNGKIYRLNLAFDSVLASIDIFFAPEISEFIQIQTALENLVVDRHPVDSGLLDAIFRLIMPDQKENSEPVIDFTQDADYIYAAFLQAYHIDLTKDRIHWCAFSRLLKSIPKGTRMREIIDIRQMPIPEPTKHNARERAEIMQAKASVAIKKGGGIQGDLMKVYKMLEARAKGR